MSGKQLDLSEELGRLGLPEAAVVVNRQVWYQDAVSALVPSLPCSDSLPADISGYVRLANCSDMCLHLL